MTEYILEHHKPAIFVVNKWDLLKDEVSMEEFADYVKKTFPMLDYVPISFITAKNGKNVYKLLNLAQQLVKQANCASPPANSTASCAWRSNATRRRPN